MPCLGLSCADLRAFLLSREQFADEQTSAAVKSGAGSAGLLWQISSMEPFARINELLMRMMGYTGMPKSSDEIDTLEWNYENWNYHIVIWGRVIEGGPDRLVQIIVTHHNIHMGGSFGEVVKEKPTQTARGAEAGESARDKSIEMRLTTLEELLRKGHVTIDEYKRKREEILSQL